MGRFWLSDPVLHERAQNLAAATQRTLSIRQNAIAATSRNHRSVVTSAASAIRAARVATAALTSRAS
jgi:hypothetical protein